VVKLLHASVKADWSRSFDVIQQADITLCVLGPVLIIYIDRYIDQSTFIPIATRTDVYKFSFFPRTVNDWNSAPAEVRLKLSSLSD